MTRSQHKFRRCGRGGLQQKHIASGTVEQRIENIRWRGGPILTEDTFVNDAAGNLHSGLTAYVAENLVKARVIRRDEKFAVRISDLGRMLGRRCVLRLEQRGTSDADGDKEADFCEARHLFVGRVCVAEVIATQPIVGNQSTA